MFQEQNIFRNNKINYFQYLQPNTKKNIAIASLVALSRFLVNKKTTNVNSFNLKNSSNTSSKLLSTPIEENLETVDKAIQTDTVSIQTINIPRYIAFTLELQELRLLKKNILFSMYCRTIDEFCCAKDFIFHHFNDLEFGTRFVYEIHEFIYNKYKEDTLLAALKNSIDNIRDSKVSVSSKDFKNTLTLQTLMYDFKCIQLFKQYNPNIK